MYGGWVSARRVLWTIIKTGGAAVTNERVADINGPNPRQIGRWWLYGAIHFQVSALGGNTFTAIKIYGSHTSNGFPVAGTTAEALVTTANPGAAAGRGLFRPMVGIGVDAGVKVPLVCVPDFLMLEYTTLVGGAGTSILSITGQFMGPQISGSE